LRIWTRFGSVAKAQSAVFLSPLRTEPQIEALEAGAVVTGESTFIILQTMRVQTQLGLPFSGYAAHVFKLGICFAFQNAETIPIELHDAIMNPVICA
jgi:hypothetical protein